MNVSCAAESETHLARLVAAEDLRQGDMVAILDQIYEYPSFLWCSDPHLLPAHEPVRVRERSRDAGRPLKVKAVCLPFVLVKSPSGRHKTLDVRRCRLVRLNRQYAKRVWKALRKVKGAG